MAPRLAIPWIDLDSNVRVNEYQDFAIASSTYAFKQRKTLYTAVQTCTMHEDTPIHETLNTFVSRQHGYAMWRGYAIQPGQQNAGSFIWRTGFLFFSPSEYVQPNPAARLIAVVLRWHTLDEACHKALTNCVRSLVAAATPITPQSVRGVANRVEAALSRESSRGPRTSIWDRLGD